MQVAHLLLTLMSSPSSSRGSLSRASCDRLLSSRSNNRHAGFTFSSVDGPLALFSPVGRLTSRDSWVKVPEAVAVHQGVRFVI